jgi:tetratricopeptide (TPR) repeat protein
MKTFITPLIFVTILATILSAQQQVPEIKIKLSEKSGFLGMGKAKVAMITLSSKNQDAVLNSDNVNAAPNYYFLLKDSGGWKIDEDFILEVLPKLNITQNGLTFALEPVSPPVKQGDHYSLHISAPKNLQLHQPVTFSVKLEKNMETAVMTVPQEFWPGYKKFSALSKEGDAAFSAGRYPEALKAYEQLLADRTLTIFPDFERIYSQRFASYRTLFTLHTTEFDSSLAGPAATKQKIASTEASLAKFTLIAENAGKEQYVNMQTKDSTAAVTESARLMIGRATFVRDSLNQALDEQTIRWIVLGSSAGKIDFKYKYVIETVASAYLSVNFADTTAPSLKTVVSEDLTARLQKYNLLNAYETFLRVVNKRWSAKEPMFPDGFLQNLVKDTAQFPLPYYSMLRAVQEFYRKNYVAAKTEITQVMRKSYAYELTERIDQLRILINTIEKNVPAEVLQRIRDGYKAEERGDNEKAIEHYKDAILIQEDYAPAAFALGKLYDRNGDSYTANNFFQKAVTADSQYYTAYRFLYINFFKNANFKPMIDLLTQALNFGNDFFDIHYYLGIAYNGSAQYDLAIQQYERALELNNKSIDANIQAGISYQNMKSYTKARDYFRRAISIDPENQTATDNLKRLDELQKKM